MSREEIEKAVLLIFEKNCGRKINIPKLFTEQYLN